MEWFSSEIDLRLPEKSLLQIWKYLGLIPPKAPGYKRQLYIISSVIMHILITICFPLTLVMNILTCDSFPELCEVTFYALPTLGASVKFACTFLLLPKLSQVSETAERLHNRLINHDELKCLQEEMCLGHRAFIRTLITFIATFFLAELAALLVVVVSEPVLVVPAWFPFDWRSNYTISIVCHIYQFSAVICVIFELVSSDAFVLIYIQYLIGHINALSVRVKKICEHPRNEDNFQELIECIKDHQHIIRFMK